MQWAARTFDRQAHEAVGAEVHVVADHRQRELHRQASAAPSAPPPAAADRHEEMQQRTAGDTKPMRRKEPRGSRAVLISRSTPSCAAIECPSEAASTTVWPASSADAGSLSPANGVCAS